MLPVEGTSTVWVNTVIRGCPIGDDTTDGLSAAACASDEVDDWVDELIHGPTETMIDEILAISYVPDGHTGLISRSIGRATYRVLLLTCRDSDPLLDRFSLRRLDDLQRVPARIRSNLVKLVFLPVGEVTGCFKFSY